MDARAEPSVNPAVAMPPRRPDPRMSLTMNEPTTSAAPSEDEPRICPAMSTRSVWRWMRARSGDPSGRPAGPTMTGLDTRPG